MRDSGLVLGFLVMLLPVFRYPHIGVLLWCWTAMVVPTYFVYGFGLAIPFNKVAAVVTLAAWVISREPKKFPMSSTLVLLALFGVLGTVSALAGIANSDLAMTEWEKFVKIILFSFVIVGLVTTKRRVDALLFSIYLSLGFHGVVQGTKFLASGGNHHVFGPAGSILGDNNHFALAMVSVLPIVLYLYKQSEGRLVRLALVGSSLLVAASIMGTFSRGGLLGIAAVGGYALMRSGKKLKYVFAMLPLVAAAIAFAPDRWSNRMDTIATADQDSSFMGRVVAWKQSTLIALDHPVFGGGFAAVQNFPVWTKYTRVFDRLDFVPTAAPDPFGAHAAHSIYFQVLGDMGFVGLVIFIAILVSSWRNATAVIRAARDRPEWRWARELATTLQYSLIAYVVSGAALSMAYFDYMYMIFALLVVMRRMVGEPVLRARWATPVVAQ